MILLLLIKSFSQGSFCWVKILHGGYRGHGWWLNRRADLSIFVFGWLTAIEPLNVLLKALDGKSRFILQWSLLLQAELLAKKAINVIKLGGFLRICIRSWMRNLVLLKIVDWFWYAEVPHGTSTSHLVKRTERPSQICNGVLAYFPYNITLLLLGLGQKRM